MNRILLSLTIFVLGRIAFADGQTTQYKLTYNVPVFNGQVQEKYPWVGGLSAPQFCAPDLNNDGVKDLVIFDRTGLKFYTFINTGTSSVIDYRYAPEYEANMPRSHGWVKFHDFNCDGIPDFFNDTNSTVRAYKGFYDKNSRLAFKLYNPYLLELTAPYRSSDTINLFSQAVELPAFEDVDGDGDMDIINFDVNGYLMYFHKNMAQELFHRCDTLVFRLDSCLFGGAEQLHWYERGFFCNMPCYGALAAPSTVLPAFTSPSLDGINRTRHTGNTICLLDMHHQGMLDLLYGNIIFDNITYLHNHGTKSSAHFECTTQDTLWPHYNHSATVPVFAAAYAVDVDNDGRKDVIVAPNDPFVNDSYHNVWLYKNIKNGGVDSFALVNDTFLIQDMIETGKGCNPAVVDIDGDGLPDLVLGNELYFDAKRTAYSSLTVYKNVGTITHPQFKLLTRDWMGLSAMSKSKHIYGFAPSFADLDGNGSIDLVMGYNGDGDAYGRIMYFINDSLAGHALGLKLSTLAIKDSSGYVIDVMSSAAPCIYDLNGDGLPDLIVGNQHGNISYYQNMGTKTAPVFANKSDSVGAIYSRDYTHSDGYSYPAVLKVDSTRYLLVAKASGSVYRYKINPNFNLRFPLIDSIITGFTTGYRSTVTVSNIFGKSNPQVLVGNYRGGLQLLSADTLHYAYSVSTNDIKSKKVPGIDIIPNPAYTWCTIVLRELNPGATLTVFDAFGIMLLHQSLTSLNSTININPWASGVYFVKICNGQNCSTSKLVKM